MSVSNCLWFDEVPAIAERILEHRNGAVSLVTRRLPECHAARNEVGVIPREIVGLEEEADPPAGLPAYRRALSRYGNRYAGVMLGTGIRDNTAGFRCYRTSTLEGIT